jgi:hypothetical protein
MTAKNDTATSSADAPVRRGSGAWVGALVVLVLLTALVASAWLYARVLAPERRAAASPPVTTFDATVMHAVTTPAAVATEQGAILALGSRYLGQPGMYAASAHVSAALRESGFEVYEQTIRTVAPHTAYREISRLSADDQVQLLDDVQVYPFMPNHFQPVVTPPEGLDGELLLLDRATLDSRHDFRDVIGVIEAAPGKVDPDYGYHFARYARLGVKALIVAHRDGLSAIDWQATVVPSTQSSALVSSVPINYVRLAATAGIFAHLGERVRLRVRVDFVEQPNQTLYGVLRAKKPATEAVVLYAPYDAPSFLPDLAPGALPALNTALLLQLARGLQATRATLERDVIVVSSGASVMGEEGLNQLLRVLQYNTFASRSNRLLDAWQPLSRDAPSAKQAGSALVLQTRLAPIEERAQANREREQSLAELVPLLSRSDFLQTPAGTQRGLSALSGAARALLLEQFQYVLNTVVFERQEPALQAKLRFERGRSNAGRPVFADYLAERRKLDQATAVAGSSPEVLIERSPAFVKSAEIPRRLRERISELAAYHARRRQELAADRYVAELFSRYRDFALLRPQLAPAASADDRAEVLSLYAKSSRETQSIDLLLAEAARHVAPSDGTFRVEPIATTPVDQNTIVEKNVAPAPVFPYWMVYGVGYQNLSWVNLGRQPSYQRWATPSSAPFMSQLESLRGSFASVGELALYLAHGNGLLGSPQGYPWQRRSYGGQVLVSNVGQSVVPNYPLKNAILGARSVDFRELYSQLGYWNNPFYLTDPYGRYDLPEQAGNFPVWWRVYDDGFAYTPLAAGFGSDGLIAYMKDEGDEGQRLFKSVAIPMSNEQLVKNTSIVTFRAAPVSILDLTNPQDFKDYKAVELLTGDGLTPFPKRCQFLGTGFVTTYVPPGTRASLLLKAGRPDNEHVSEVRAFLLDSGARATGTPSGGYLPADHPILLDVPREAALSMVEVNGERLALQNRYRMADERTNAYQAKALDLLKQARAPALSNKLATLKARDAVSYAALNHPVLRESVFEAVVGILWYLGLLVPFVYFAEKLMFCFSDIRRQLAAHAAIFLTVFALLRWLHPAFQMVRSSLMILLGFVIVLISVGITLMFASAAKENLSELRKRQGKVAGAEVNTLGVLSSSFLVGLNNMHRRRVRTGLTCATLTLLTFVMICFTSAQNDLVDEVSTLGRAEYQGLLTRHDDFLAMTESELFALKSKFSERFAVAERRFYIGQQDWNERRRYNPSLTAGYQRPDGTRKVAFSSILKLSPAEPLRAGIRFVAGPGWFLPEHARDDGKPCPVLLPDKLAERLGVSSEQVQRGDDVNVTLNGVPFRVWGIFSAESLDGLRDLNGLDLLPFDIERVSTLGETSLKGVTVGVDEPRIPAEKIVITPPRELKLAIPNGNEVIASVAVDMGKSGFREAKQEIEAHLEKTAQPAFYGLDGVAYRGLRTRKLTLAGLLELLVPLLIAGLTVLNTMRGSVYERRAELYVYNAVGIAPRYVVAMFLAEAFVYAVVGSVLGYLLSQGVGRVLSALQLTGGLNMTFTSIATIYASLAIAAAVFVSTWFPARSAMEIASPAEDSGWQLPEPQGDLLAFDLPFNFDWRDRVAVLAFFERWLNEHGEGSAGRFFAEPPRAGVAPQPDAQTGGLVPEMRGLVWLKPFDLAVSQELCITTPADPETDQFKARLELTRRGGTREAWLRLNHAFVTALRQHFLHWRAVSDVERQEMFELAKLRLEQRYGEPPVAAPPVVEPPGSEQPTGANV